MNKGPGSILLVDPPLPETEYDVVKVPKKPAVWRPQPSIGGGFLPPMREYSAGAMCNGSYYMFGGLGAGRNGRFNVLARLDLDSLKWEQVQARSGGPPGARSKHTLTCYRDKIYVYGGEAAFKGDFCTGDNRSSRDIFNTMFSYDTKKQSWRAISSFGVPPEKATPSARRGHTCDLYERGLKNRGPIFLVFGGSGPEPVKSRDRLLGDLWSFELDINKWRKVKTRGDAPCARSNHSTIIVGDKMYLYGGVVDGGTSPDLYELNIPKQRWTHIGTMGHGPGALYGHSLHLHPWRKDSLVVFGGRDTHTQATADTWVLDLEGKHANWRREKTGTTPEGRVGHVSVLFKKFMLVYGGCGAKGYANSDLQVYCFATPPVREDSVMKFSDTDHEGIDEVVSDAMHHQPHARPVAGGIFHRHGHDDGADHFRTGEFGHHHAHGSPSQSYRSFKKLTGQKRTTSLDHAILPPDPFAPPPPPYRGFKALMSAEQKMQMEYNKSLAEANQADAGSTTMARARTAPSMSASAGRPSSGSGSKLRLSPMKVRPQSSMALNGGASSLGGIGNMSTSGGVPEVLDNIWSASVLGGDVGGLPQSSSSRSLLGGGSRSWMHQELGKAYRHPKKKLWLHTRSLPNIFPGSRILQSRAASRGSAIFHSPSRLGSPSRLDTPVGSVLDMSYGLSMSVLNNSSNVL
jgi:hypothetical protein